MLVWDEKIEEKFRDRAAYNDGVEAGKAEGKKLGTTEMIINMHKDKVPNELISKYANISEDEVQKIIDCNHD